MGTEGKRVPEPLFLEYSTEEVLEGNNGRGIPFVQPWGSEYVNAIHGRRYGDAIWARYHIRGSSDDDEAVRKEIEVDARECRENDPYGYADAILLYSDNSSADGHLDLIEMILRIAKEDASEHHAKVQAEERAEAEAHLNWLATTFAEGEAKLAEALARLKAENTLSSMQKFFCQNMNKKTQEKQDNGPHDDSSPTLMELHDAENEDAALGAWLVEKSKIEIPRGPEKLPSAWYQTGTDSVNRDVEFPPQLGCNHDWSGLDAASDRSSCFGGFHLLMAALTGRYAPGVVRPTPAMTLVDGTMLESWCRSAAGQCRLWPKYLDNVTLDVPRGRRRPHALFPGRS
ncbi:hypothetical protein FG04489.1 [Paecilomyces variotii No. 5]|uniref:Uncharacterized protein n=1 Tax=Byssochlamys spectabilis (strain No. 5 / NBRC 109023) TaxID=1356009 RepID=V5FTM3_BYSSN|nr:hypothetical protein FG04489.1 [Paecilomyces variotii No. 5]